MSDKPHIALKVIRAPEGSALAVGATFPVVSSPAVVGRSPEADIVLPDTTVSRRHLRIHVGPPVQVESLTASNGTFVDRVRLAPDQPTAMPSPASKLQLGGVVLSVVAMAETRPVREPLASLVREAPSALLQVRWDAGQCSVRCRGRELGLTGAAARMLGVLAEHVGEIVHHWDLQQELETHHLAPLATAIRNALASTVQEGVVPLSLFQQRLEAAVVSADAPDDLTELMRRVVHARRGHGYVLQLQPSDVDIQRV